MTASVLLGGSLVVPADAAEDGQEAGEPPDPAAIAKLLAEFQSLAPEHENFKDMVGQWKIDAEYYWHNPEVPKRTQASASFKLLLGGRFVQHNFRDSVDGVPFEGIGIYGYDKMKNKFVGIWIDNMGTGMMHTTGEMDEAGNVVEHGESAMPQATMKLKMVSTPVKDDKFTYTMYRILPDGSEQRVMVLSYRRK
jgi:hypothetical protein